MADFLVNVASGPDFMGGMWVVLELTEAARARLLSLRDVFHTVQGFHPVRNLYGIEVFDSLPVYFGRFVADGYENLDEAAWRRCSTAPRRAVDDEHYEEPRVAVMTVHVLSDGLQWEWVVKHVDDAFFSATLPWSVVEDVATAEEAR